MSQSLHHECQERRPQHDHNGCFERKLIFTVLSATRQHFLGRISREAVYMLAVIEDPNVIFNGLPSLYTAAYDKWQEQHQAGECCELCVLRFLGSQGATYQNQKWSNIVTSIFHMF